MWRRASTLHRGVREVFAIKRPTARQRASVRQGRGLTASERPAAWQRFFFTGLILCKLVTGLCLPLIIISLLQTSACGTWTKRGGDIVRRARGGHTHAARARAEVGQRCRRARAMRARYLELSGPARVLQLYNELESRLRTHSILYS